MEYENRELKADGKSYDKNRTCNISVVRLRTVVQLHQVPLSLN